MPYKILILNIIFASSCQLLNPKTIESKWEPLHTSQSVDCDPWPQGRSELQIQTISQAPGMGFVTQSKDRMGRNIYSFRPFSGDSVSKKANYQLNWGQRAQYLGVVKAEGTQFLAIGRTLRQKTVIELRDLKRNVVRYSSNDLPHKIHGLGIFPSSKGFWLTYKRSVDDESLDDARVRVMDVSLEKEGKLVTNVISGLALPPETQAVPINDKNLFLIWLDRRNDSYIFQYAILNEEGRKPKYQNFRSGLEEKVESWKASQHRDGILLTYILGDTLVWENASLEVHSLDLKGDQVWNKSFKIENEHVGDPIIIPYPTFSYLVLPKWLDGESSLSVYKVSYDEIEDQGYFGVFKEGTYQVMGLATSDEEKILIINRQPAGFVKKYSVCEIEK